MNPPITVSLSRPKRRTISFHSTGRLYPRRLRFGAKTPRQDEIRTTLRSRIECLEFLNRRLQLEVAQIVPLKGYAERLELRVAELERLMKNDGFRIDNTTPVCALQRSVMHAINTIRRRDNGSGSTNDTISSSIGFPIPSSLIADNPSISATQTVSDEPASVDGVWATVGSSRHWVKDLAALDAVKKRHSKKAKRNKRRTVKRKLARQKHNSAAPLNSQHLQVPDYQPQLSQHHRGRQYQQNDLQLNPPQHHPTSRLYQSDQDQHQRHQRRQQQSRDDPIRSHTPGSDTWIYVTGVANDNTVATVKQYVSERIHRENIDCFLLLPRGVDPRTRRFLSFKVRIPSSCAYIVTQRSFWPVDVTARYFVSEQDF